MYAFTTRAFTTHVVTPHRRHTVASSLAALTLIATFGGPASASPDPGPARQDVYAHLTPGRYPLLRVGEQLCRGDYLTGAGVAAPLTVPEG